jgi:heat shock protein HslJ
MARATLAAALVLAACGPSGPDREGTAFSDGAPPDTIAAERGWLLPGSQWRLTSLDGAPFEAPLVAELTVDGRVVGEGPCNRFSANYSGRLPDLTFEPVAATRRACPDLPLETAAFAALGRVDTAALTGGRLILTGADGTALAFDPA